jgi:hypothetical protein
MRDVRSLPSLIDRLGQAETRRDDLWARIVDLKDAYRRELDRLADRVIDRAEFDSREELIREQNYVIQPAFEQAKREAADLLRAIEEMLT